MSNYGQLLENIEPEKDVFRSHINSYFNYPIMVKIKDVENASVYMSKMYCLLSNECRYLVAFILKDDKPSGTQYSLRDLNWFCFQTRTLTDYHELPPHSYNPSPQGPLNVPIRRKEVTPESSEYIADNFNVIVTLLHKNISMVSDYPPTGNIISALETYQTIITFNKHS
jgi:hypothetical protein